MSFDALPPPPTIRRFTPDGLPTQAQVEYDNRDYQARKEIEKNITENFDSIDGINGVLSVQWSIIGNIDGVTGGLTFTGIKKADGTGPVFDLEINSNVTINGNLLVNGSVITNKIADAAILNEKITNNAVSNSAFTRATNTPSTPASVTINLRAGARVSILVTYDGGDGLFLTPSIGELRAQVNGLNFTNNSILIRPVGAALGFTQALISGTLVLTSVSQNYISGAVTLLTYYVAPSNGSYEITAFSSSGFTQGVNVLVMELSK